MGLDYDARNGAVAVESNNEEDNTWDEPWMPCHTLVALGYRLVESEWMWGRWIVEYGSLRLELDMIDDSWLDVWPCFHSVL